MMLIVSSKSMYIEDYMSITRFFYKLNWLSSVCSGGECCNWLDFEALRLVQLRSGKLGDSLLLATFRDATLAHDVVPIAYSAYGVGSNNSGASLIGFKGERQDFITRCYLLGNGLRAFCPFMMRFISPDSLSPFAQGGVNSYAFCENDPVNFSDKSGRARTRIFNPVPHSPWVPAKPYALKEISGHSKIIGSENSVAGTSRKQGGSALAFSQSQPKQNVRFNVVDGSKYVEGGWRSSKQSVDLLIAANDVVTAPTQRTTKYTTEHLRQAMYYAVENAGDLSGYVEKAFPGDKSALNTFRAKIHSMETRVVLRSVRKGEQI